MKHTSLRLCILSQLNHTLSKDETGSLLVNEIPADLLGMEAAARAAGGSGSSAGLDAAQSCAMGSGSFKIRSCVARLLHVYY